MYDVPHEFVTHSYEFVTHSSASRDSFIYMTCLINMCAVTLNMCTEPCISAKHPYIPTKEPYISANSQVIAHS